LSTSQVPANTPLRSALSRLAQTIKCDYLIILHRSYYRDSLYQLARVTYGISLLFVNGVISWTVACGQPQGIFWT